MRFGTAPVSFGVYGPSEGDFNLSPPRLVEAMAASGYEGAELPPAGYAGAFGAATRLFENHGLIPVGIYIPIHFADPDLQMGDEARMKGALAELETADKSPRLAILADEGSDTLLLHPGRGNDPTFALSKRKFDCLTSSVSRLAAEIRRRGLTPSFHPHVSTYVESPAEIEQLLDATDIDLTFDTGHIALGGGHVRECWKAWRNRINHVHLKDVRPGVMEQAKSQGREDFEVWWADVSVPLGEGDLALQEFLALLHKDGYRGWVIVEQDRAPLASSTQIPGVISTQTANLQWIRRTVNAL